MYSMRLRRILFHERTILVLEKRQESLDLEERTL